MSIVPVPVCPHLGTPALQNQGRGIIVGAVEHKLSGDDVLFHVTDSFVSLSNLLVELLEFSCL